MNYFYRKLKKVTSMKKLITLLAILISAYANAQVAPVNDTVRITPTAPTFSPQFQQNIFTSGGVNYRVRYDRNPSTGTYDFAIYSKYLRAFYLAKVDSVLNSGYVTHGYFNQYAIKRADSSLFVTPWQFLHGNNTITGAWDWYGTNIFHNNIQTLGRLDTYGGVYINNSGLLNIQPGSNILFQGVNSRHWYESMDQGPDSARHFVYWNNNNQPIADIIFSGANGGEISSNGTKFAKVGDTTGWGTKFIKAATNKQGKIYSGDTSRAIRTIFIGSSITKGVGQDGVVEYDSTFVNKLARIHGIKTYNRGYSGRAIQGGVNTPDSSFYSIRANLPNYYPGDYIVLECQVNDAIDSTHYSIGVYKVQLDSVVLRLTGQRNWPANHIILANYAYFNPPASSAYPNVEHRHDEYANLMQQEATLRGTLFYDDYYTFKTKYIATPALLDAAVLHPTPAGYTVAAADFTTWFSSYVTPIDPIALQIRSVGAASVYGDLTVAQNASINNDLAVGNKITASAISISGLPTLMDDTGTAFTPSGGQTTNSGSLGYSMAVMDGTNNRRAGPFISSTAFGMSQLYSTSGLPWGVWSAGTKWIGASGSGVTLPIISAYGSTATNFLTAVSGLVESRTPAQVLADILAAPIASPTFTGTVNTPALTVTANSGADVTPVLFTNANASGGTGLLINRTNTARTASVQFETSGTVAWATGMLRNGGSANTSFFIGQNADANVTVPVLSLTTTARLGVNVIAPTAFLDLPAAITGSSTLRIREAGLDPTTNNAGDIWVNGGLLKYYDGTNSAIRTIANIAQAQTLTNKTLTTPKLTGYTVATLPAGTIGMIAYVTDALTPTFGNVLVGGGAVVAKAFYNGTNWINE